MEVTNPRDFAHNKHNQVDDTPYGAGRDAHDGATHF